MITSIGACGKRQSNSICDYISEAANKRSVPVQTYLNDSLFHVRRAIYEKGLALKSINDSIDGIELRIWDEGRFDTGYLYRLRKQKNGSWVGEKYIYHVMRLSDRFLAMGSGQLISKSDSQWETLLENSFKEGLLEFPDYQSVPPLTISSTHATAVNFEAACGQKYLYYRYLYPINKDETSEKIFNVVKDFESAFSN